jgi:hypothetical protein
MLNPEQRHLIRQRVREQWQCKMSSGLRISRHWGNIGFGGWVFDVASAIGIFIFIGMELNVLMAVPGMNTG